MAENKNQHYVPQSYQRHFSDDGKNTGVYILKAKKYIASSKIQHQASKDYFYSKDLVIEHELSKLEGWADVAIKSVLSNPKRNLTPEERKILYVNMMLQAGRTFSQVRLVEALFTEITQQLMAADKRVDDEYHNGKYDGITEEDIANVEIKLTEPGKFVVGNIIKLMGECEDLSLRMLINKTEVPFITSDNPVCLFNQFLEKIGENTIGLAQRGLQLYMPISSRVALIYYDDKVYNVGSKLQEYVEVSKPNDIKELNKLIISQANEILMIQDSMSSQLDFDEIQAVYETYHHGKLVEGVSERVADNEDNLNTIIGFIQNRKDCHCKLSFVKMRPPYITTTSATFDKERHMYRKPIKRWSIETDIPE